MVLYHLPRDKECGIRYSVWTDADVPVLNKLDGLGMSSNRTQYSGAKLLQAV